MSSGRSRARRRIASLRRVTVFSTAPLVPPAPPLPPAPPGPPIPNPPPDHASPQPASLVPAALGLLSTLILTGIGIATLNRPASKTFVVTATCQSLRVARPAVLSLGHDASEIRVRGFVGTIGNIDLPTLPDRKVTLTADPDNPTNAPPSLHWQVTGLGGRVGVDAKEFFAFRAAGNGGLELQTGSKSTLHMQAQAVTLAGARYRETVPTAISNTNALVDATLDSPSATAESEALIRVQWPSKVESIRLEGPQGKQLAGETSEIQAGGCTSHTIKIGDEGGTATRGGDANLRLATERFTFEKLVFEPPRDTSASGLGIRLTGAATSIHEDDRELIPTIIAELFEGQPYERGFVGAALLFVVFAGATIFKRSLDVFVNRMIPE